MIKILIAPYVFLSSLFPWQVPPKPSEVLPVITVDLKIDHHFSTDDERSQVEIDVRKFCKSKGYDDVSYVEWHYSTTTNSVNLIDIHCSYTIDNYKQY